MRAWHYTIGPKLAPIIAEGVLRPTTKSRAQHEPRDMPVLWVSRDPDWERSAAKMVYDPITNEKAWMERDDHAALLLVRFGYPAVKLTPWPKIGRVAGVHVNDMARLEKAGRDLGANPRDWLGTLKRIPLRDLVCEVWLDAWTPCPVDAAAVAWEHVAETQGLRVRSARYGDVT